MGGVTLAAAFIGIEVFVAFADPEERAQTPGRNATAITSLAMFCLGLWDDLWGLGAKRKLIGQVLIASVVCYFGLGIQLFRIPFIGTDISLGGWGVLITVLWLVGLTNLINLIDGADGLAGGICLMLMILMAYVGYQGGNFELLASGMAGALLGFLWFNFPPARIYLGDSGAYFLGFQIGLFSLISSHKGEVFAALVAPMFALALPILDTSLAILRRSLRGLPLFRPDRHHLHHHLLEMGFSRRKLVLSFYAVTLIFLILGFATIWSRGEWVPGLLGLGAFILLVCAGNMRFSREWFNIGRVVGNSLEMRQEIQFALSLMRWLELDAQRSQSLDELWEDFVFAARKLGFTSVTLTSVSGRRLWQHPTASSSTVCFRHELHDGRSGILELVAPTSEQQDAPNRPEVLTTNLNPLEGSIGERSPGLAPLKSRLAEAPNRPVSSKTAFEILSELLAEGWLKAAAGCTSTETFPPPPRVPVNPEP